MSKLIVQLAAGAGLAAIAGCATYEEQTSYGEGLQYAGAERLLPGAPVESQPFVEIDNPASFAAAPSPAPAPLLAQYEGIDGARRAHRLYTEVEAESLDGACERFVKIERGETLNEIADYCDVPLTEIVAYNPAIRNVRFSLAGETVEIPQRPNAERAALAASGGILQAGWYVAQPGDTLQTIADRHLVSAAAVANLNPNVDWAALPAGAALKIPNSATAPAVVVLRTPSSAPYAAPGYERRDAGVGSSEATAQMPYRLTPPGTPSDVAPNRPSLLTVDRVTAKPGEQVTVSASGLRPNAEVSLYRGPNGKSLEFVKTVETDASGSFSTAVPAGADNLGGVIFKATSGDDKLLSPRVGVNALDSD
jgi:LysM repeat protein